MSSSFTGTFLSAYNVWTGSGWILPEKKGEGFKLRVDKNGHQYLRFTLKVPAGKVDYNYIEVRSWEPAAIWIKDNIKPKEWIILIGTLMQDTVELESRTGKPRIRLWTHVIARDVKRVPLSKPFESEEVPWKPKETT